MGKEFDSVKEKMSILESQITSMIDAGIDPADANLQKLLDTYKELSKQGGSTTDKLSEGLEKFANVAGQIMGQVGAIFAQHHEMKMQTLENERAAQEEDLISDFETQKEAIENAVMTQQEKDLALEELEKSHNVNMEGISQTYENELFDYILRYKELKNHYPNNKKAILMLLTFSNRNWEKYTNKLIIK